jgi:hypothetical protein
MKNRLLSPLFIGLMLSAVLAHCQQLTIQIESGKQLVLSKSEIETLPHVKVTIPASHDSEAPAIYEGVALESLLERAGLAFGHSLRGKRMASCLLVEAADGYHVVIALPEIDSDFTAKQVVLAFSQNGKPLDQKEGPYRIIIPDEKRMARWVKQVITLKIVEVQ